MMARRIDISYNGLMSYEIAKHTADLRMKVEGKTPEELFAEALRGMMGVLKEGSERGEKRKRKIAVQSGDRTSLLVDFLNEALAAAQINREVYDRAVFRRFSETELEAELEGAAVGSFDEDIKAVTYHEADVRRNEKGEWETGLVFDI